MTEMGRIAALALIAAVCAAAIRKQVPEIALLLALCAGVLILLGSIRTLEQILAAVHRAAQYGGISGELLEPVLKVTGISLLTRITADICRDGQQGGLAGAVETAGTLLSLGAVLPLVMTVLTLLTELLQET